MLRNAARLKIDAWRGLNTFTPKESLDPQSWYDSNNVLVNARGEADVLRSPNAFGSTTGGSGTLTGLFEYRRVAGNALIVDQGTASYYYLAAGGPVTSLRTGQNGAAWTSLNINDRLFRIDGTEFVQILNDLSTARRVGIDPPAAAPTIAYVAAGAAADDILVSLQGSYAYYNSATGHVSSPSPLSNILAPSALNSVSFTTVASSQTGVDKLVFFLTVDGGAIPYLIIDVSDSDPHEESNATTTYTLALASIDRDTLTPETIYNDAPPVTGTSMFEHKDRIFLIVDGALRYSGYETCYFGNPQECWPPLNQLILKGDRAVGGLSMQAGALIFGKQDSFLLSGFPSDKTTSPENASAVTEHLDPLNWRIGITYPQTAVTTPFGAIWTDQTLKIRNWNMTGYPTDIAKPLRTELDGMTGTLKARWFQHGENGGYYVLTNGVNTLFVVVYTDKNGQVQFGYGKSTTLTPDGLASCTFSAVERFFYAKTNQVYEILDTATEGDGWTAGTPIFFKFMVGNDDNFSTLHSLQIEGDALDDMSDTTVTIGTSDETSVEELVLTNDIEVDTGGALYGIVDSPQRRRHSVAVEFSTEDTEHRSIDGVQIFAKNNKRAI